MKIALIIPDKIISDALEEALATAGICIRQVGSFVHVVEWIPYNIRPAQLPPPNVNVAPAYLEGGQS